MFCVALHVQQTLEPLFTVSRLIKRRERGGSLLGSPPGKAENMVLQRQHLAVDLQSTSLSPFYQPGNGEKRLQSLLHV